MIHTKPSFTAACALIGALSPAAAGAAKLTYVYEFGNETPAISHPATSVTVKNGFLFGTVQQTVYGDGAVYKVDLATKAETTLFNFRGGSNDGADPAQLVKLGDNFYGTTRSGYINNNGIVFSIDPATGKEVVLHGFDGTTGAKPNQLWDALVPYRGALYGVTQTGGTNNLGTVFKITTIGVLTTIVQFASGAGGCNPVAGPIIASGVLYGTTSSCGANGDGTIYSVDLETGAYTVIHAFDFQPVRAYKLLFLNNALYGTTFGGGANSSGSVYRVDLTNQAYTVLHSFSQSELVDPTSGVSVIGNTLYGLAYSSSGTINDVGGVYSLDLTTNAEHVTLLPGVHDAPSGALTVVRKNLYGAAGDDADAKSGAIFKFTP